MLMRIVTLALFTLIQWQHLQAAQVTYANLLPPHAVANFVKSDASGNIYVAGTTPGWFTGVFISKISSDGATLIYNQFLGVNPIGGQSVGVQALAVSPDGVAYVTSFFVAQAAAPGSSSTITKLDPLGNILLNGPMGPASQASLNFVGYILDMAADADGNLYATGVLGSASSPPTVIAGNQSTGFLYKMDSNLNILWSAGYGGTHMAIDPAGNVYIVGTATAGISTTPNAFQQAFSSVNNPNFAGCGMQVNQIGAFLVPCAHQYVIAVDKSGSRLIYATYLTGTFQDVPAGIAVDASGNAYVAGSTHSFDFPVTGDALQPDYEAQAPNPAFPPNSLIVDPVLSGNSYPKTTYTPVSATGYVAALNPSGTDLVFSTFFGGSATDLITAVALDAVNQTIDVAGNATSPDLPGVDGAYRQCVPQSFLARLSLDGTAAKRTVLVPVLNAFTPTGQNSPFFAGGTASGYIDFDAPDSEIACVANSFDLSISNSVAPGQLLTIFGHQFAPSPLSVAPVGQSLPTSSSGLQVTIGGVPAPLLYVSPGQINLQAPFELAGQTQTTLQLSTVNAEGNPITATLPLSINNYLITVLQSPDQAGDCVGSYLNQMETFVINADGTRNTCANPAKLSSIVTIFVDAVGVLPGNGTTGLLNSSAPSPVTLPVTLTSNDIGPAPTLVSAQPLAGSVSGLYVFQIQLPDTEGLNNSVNCSLQINGYPEENTISIPVTPN